ncbi:hypothetical protein TNCV_4076551 [Trichonephila clavipes]|nr:hypothetical protein TNCV_4076551 [Trichonephila clavipes]
MEENIARRGYFTGCKMDSSGKDYSCHHRKIFKASVFQGHKLVPYRILHKQEGMDNHRNSLINALIMIDKAWSAVTPLKFTALLKKSGFPSPNLVDLDDSLNVSNAEFDQFGRLFQNKI